MPDNDGELFRVLLRFEINPGMEADFERTWLSIGNVITGHPANLGQRLMRSAEEESVYYVISDWVDEKHFREFEHSDAHVEHRTKLHPYRRGGAMHIMSGVHFLPSASAGGAR
ncbi:antibiotic biosynthesis monooxygenase family protein [Streptomyces acidicola]|uniref:Antibiotic biosynthesis monooxygenase n=1 Tax=Streptomyces acidicola TaxID=2596892 RepID=A0A5N8WN30_9ACTN|nr:antibiotic biosynthesis monooxygenase family protein [Streptomyces acidicola]MPY48853.1 antibiotic biosynthesis monooxygenase [Streptomyces acidicola]